MLDCRVLNCVIYQFADDVPYHDMTLLYPLSVIRRNNHPVVAERSERSPIPASKSYRPRTNPSSLLNTENHVLGTSTRAYRYDDVASLHIRIDLS